MITFEQVGKQFPNGTIAFNNLSFSIDEGGTVLITGPSGSGKTTIMRLLIREYLPSSGTIIFEGNKLDNLPNNKVPEHRQKIGVVFQDYKLIEELNIWENIALPLDIKRRSLSEIESRVTDLLKLVGLTDKALMFPKQLSGGEAQRIAIARALATGPRLIFADEPTGNLDSQTGQRIISLLKKINQLGTTLLVATHDPKVIKQLDVKRVDLTKFQASEEKGGLVATKQKKPKKISSELKKSQDKKKAKSKVKEDNQEEKEQEKNDSSQKEKLSQADKKQKSDQSKTGIVDFLTKIFGNKNIQDQEESKKTKPKTKKSKNNQDQSKQNKKEKKNRQQTLINHHLNL